MTYYFYQTGVFFNRFISSLFFREVETVDVCLVGEPGKMTIDSYPMD